MEIWVNKVGGDLDSEFSIDVSNGILHVDHLRKAINQSVECAKAPERFGFGAVDIYTDASATAEHSARDTLFVNGQLKWTLLFFSQPAQPAQQGVAMHYLFTAFNFFCLFLSIFILYFNMLFNLC